MTGELVAPGASAWIAELTPPSRDRLHPKRTAVAVRVACMLIRDEWLRAQQWAAWVAR